MNRNIKYKQVCRLVLHGFNDLLKNSTSSQYSCNNSAITNSKIMRFSLNNSLNDVKLSQNARCILEACQIPNIPNLINHIAHIRLGASSETKTYDSMKGLNGNPIIFSSIVHAISVSSLTVFNYNEMLHSFHVASNFLEKGYIEIELESINVLTSIDFINSNPMNHFFISLIIIDEDVELTKDLTLAPPIDYNTYNVNMPIRNY